jgi:hypothetical protein
MSSMSAPVEVIELGAFKASTLQWRPHNSVPVLTVVAKTTYKLAPGVAELAEMQDDVNKRDLHAENNPKKGLHSASDLAPYKPRADVTVVGRAYSPPHELSRMLVARVKVGSVDKRVQVHADRFLENGRVVDDKFFSKMAIGYERAFGGPSTANPVGIGVEGRPDSRGRVKLPNLQAPGTEIVGPNAKHKPYAFGPIPPTWPTRKSMLNGVDISFLRKTPMAHEIPSSFPWTFFNVGPPDQQLDEIRSDQEIHLEHLHPEEPQLDVRLPGFYPCVYVHRASEAFRVQMKGDTLWIDTNRLVLTVTWRAQVSLSGDPNAPVRVLVALGRPDHKPTWDQVWAEAEARKAREKWASRMTHTETPQSRRPAKGTDVIDEPLSHRGVTSPVPLRSPGSDRQTQWLPTPRASGSGPGFSASPPVSSQPGSARHPQSGGAGLVVEVGLDDADVQRLRELCNATGFNATEMLRQALREMYKSRFGE